MPYILESVEQFTSNLASSQPYQTLILTYMITSPTQKRNHRNNHQLG